MLKCSARTTSPPPGRFVNSAILLLVAFNLSKNHCQLGNASGATSLGDKCRGHYITNPNNALLIREIHQKHHTFVLFDPSQMGPIEWPLKCQKKPWTVAPLLVANRKLWNVAHPGFSFKLITKTHHPPKMKKISVVFWAPKIDRHFFNPSIEDALPEWGGLSLYLHIWVVLEVNVGKYTIYIEHRGICKVPFSFRKSSVVEVPDSTNKNSPPRIDRFPGDSSDKLPSHQASCYKKPLGFKANHL